MQGTNTYARKTGEEYNGVDLSLYKVVKEPDDKENAAPWVTFTLSGNSFSDTKTTGTGGTLTFAIPGDILGSYTLPATKTFSLTELEAPKGYRSESPWTVTLVAKDIVHKDGAQGEDITVYDWKIDSVVDNTGMTVTLDGLNYKIINERKTGEEVNGVNLALAKVKKNGDDSVTAGDGITFTLNGNGTNEEKTTDAEGKLTFTIAGNDLGTFTLPATKTFSLTENEVPQGYKSTGPWTVTLVGSITHRTNEKNEYITVYNWAIDSVTDSTGNEVKEESLVYTIVNEQNKRDEINGVEVALYKVTNGPREAEAAAPGITFTLSGDAVNESKATEADGRLTFTIPGDKLGSYTLPATKTFSLTELAAPDGYRSESPWTVTLVTRDIDHKEGTQGEYVTVYSWEIDSIVDKAGNEVDPEAMGYKIVNERITGERTEGINLTLHKVTTGPNENEKAASGITFTLLGDKVDQTMETGLGGTLTFEISGDQLGSYTLPATKAFSLREPAAPDGYRSDGPWTVTLAARTITYDVGANNEDITIYSWEIDNIVNKEGTPVSEDELGYKIVNERKTGKISVQKSAVKATGETLTTDGTFTFEIREMSPINGATAASFMLEVKGNGSAVETGNLPLGRYTVKEAHGPEIAGYDHTRPGLKVGNAAAVDNSTVEVEVTEEGATVAVLATNHYTRNLGSLVIRKSVTLNGKSTDTKAVDGTYLFTVQSVEGVEPATSATVSVTVTNGRMSGAKLEKASSDQVTVMLTDDGAQISGLPTGGYTVTEDETGLAEKHIQLTDKPTEPILVTKAGTGEIQTAAFVNNRTTYVSAAVRKVWDDDGNRDGLRPAGITLKLLANGEEYRGGNVTLNEANHWTALLEGLPETDEKGEKIAYEWTEPAAGSGYTLSGKVTEGALTVLTNRHATEETKVSVKKVWNDRENELKKRPDSITVQLYADGLAEGGVVTLNAGNNWEYSWDHLKKNIRENGQTRTIEYTVAETQVPAGYDSLVTGSAGAGYVITNTIEKSQLVIEKEFDIQVPPIPPEPEEETTDIEIVKIWDDNDNADGNRPASITVRLYAGGVEVKSRELTAANGWRTKFGELPKFVNGHPIHYSVMEDPVEWYTTEIRGFTITNHYHPETTSVSVRKVWNDENNKLKIRPKSVRMTLNNGISVILNAANGWQATVGGLPARVNGQPAVYTWTEQEIIGYELESKVTDGNTTVFTNRPWTRPDEPSKGKKPRLPGETLYVFEEYDTPLGVEIVINHVGDCFD